MVTRFLITGTLAAGLVVSVLNWVTAAILPPCYKQFKDPDAVVEAIRANVSGNDIYTAAQELFVPVSIRPRLQSFGPRIACQFAVEFAVALGLSLLLLAVPLRSSIQAAIIDWHSRYVLSWGLSVTLESSFCLEALGQAILLHGKPDIFNSDQGSQFTSTEFTDRLKAEGIRVSMDGRGRALDNIFVERLWRSVKYEEVYLHDYATVTEALLGLKKYFLFYSTERQHQSLDYRTPKEVYDGQPSGGIKTLCAA